MSGAARRRGGRGPTNEMSDTSSRRGEPQSLGTLAAPPGGFDGPASRGSASGPPGSQGASAVRRGSNTPSQPGTAPQSQPTSPRLGQGQFGIMSGSQPGSRAGAPPAAPEPPRRDPALDPGKDAKLTDSLKNVDLPASFYNMNREVCFPII